MRTTKITIGRLYNLGNYEHIRYEISVEIGEGQSAATAITGLENILTALNPTMPPGVLSDRQIEDAKERIKKVEAKPDNEVAERHGKCKALVIAEAQKKLDAAIVKTTKWNATQRLARRMLDDLGGAEKFVDAKQNWDNDYYNDDF